MKILGLGEGKYICEVSDEEIWELVDHTDDDEEWSLEAGQEIDLARAIKASRWIRNMDSEHLDRVIRELQTTLSGVERIKHTASALTLFDKLSEEA